MATGDGDGCDHPGPDRRRFLQAGALGLIGWGAGLEAAAGETLYNGIRLPASWPPRPKAIPREPVTPPYLTSPPAVIPIDVGRQLFVDDFLIEQTSLRRTFHRARYHPACPVLAPDKSWERAGGGGPVAMVFSDGVWYDPKDGLFKMWYMGGLLRGTCYAASEDGTHWSKPALDVRKGTNLVQGDPRDSSTVWLDLEEPDPRRRFKMFRSYLYRGKFVLSAHFSADGIHWGEVAVRTGPCGDRTTVFWNPFRKVWVYSLRNGGGPRLRRYRESRELLTGPRWEHIDEPPLWIGADRLDPERADLKVRPELYNLDAVAYESLLLGLFTIWRGQPADRAKPNDIVLGYSRDGWHWSRPDRRAFCPVSDQPGTWNYSNAQSAGGCCLVVGDRLYFYVSGRAGVAGGPGSGRCSCGLAVLRRDGFASMDAGVAEGTLTTRPVRFRGRHLFVNADCAAGELRVEVLDGRGRTVAPFSRQNCRPVRADATLQRVRWKGAGDLAALAGKAVRFRFALTRGRLYSFWVSPEASGASHGYVAAGGPGFTGPKDDVGLAAYEAAARLHSGKIQRAK